ncbi:MAG: acyltransferase [Deltaproteobacteria bacterium]|nr:acyltransferase [Deltaproteobacteria bacterium]
MSQPRLGAVNGLRGIAILGVIWHHVASLRPGFSILSNAWLGVNLFFVLSGLVLYLPFARGARTLETRADVTRFYRRRATRLLPLYYVNVGVLLAIAASGALATLAMPSSTEIALLATITYVFTKAWYAPSINSPLWSFGLEWWFSVLFPLLAIVARRAGIARFFVGILLFALAVRFVGVAFPIFDRPHNPFLNPMKDGVLGRADDFAVGMLLAVLLVRGSSIVSEKRATVLGVVGLVLVCAGASLWDLKVTKVLPAIASPLFGLVVNAGLFAVTAAAIGATGVVGRILRSAALQVPGKMCFSIYLWHNLLNRWLLGPGAGIGPHLAFFALLALVSAVSYRFVEFRHERDWRALFRPDP